MPEPAPSSWTAHSRDGTPIAVAPLGDGPSLILVHGAAADHTTFRVLAPRLATHRTTHAIDRRGRGRSGDTLPYSIEREFEDIVAVAEALAEADGAPIDVLGHSYGGRCALGAALRTTAIRRVISYEGAPTPPGQRYGDAAVLGELVALDAAGQPEALLETFLRRVVGMTDADIAAYRANPVWPDRVAAAPTIVRELAAEGAEGGPASLEALGAIRQPVLQLLGGESLPAFRAATEALDARLRNGRIVTIPGARHAAHHTHPDAVVAAVTEFLGEG